MTKKKRDIRWYKKLRSKYRLVIFNDQTFEESVSFRLTRLNVMLIFSAILIVSVTVTFVLISNTQLKTYIPGYPDIDDKRQIYNLNILADSLLEDIEMKNTYISAFKNIFNEYPSDEEVLAADMPKYRYDTIKNRKSVRDSILRAEFENQSMHNLYFTESGQLSRSEQSSIKSFNFFPPIKGIITNKFNLMEDHFGIDIVTSHNEAVKATLDGTVVFAGWTLETGYIISIQHKNNFISIYKHNSVLLKKEGDIVVSGEPIAITGESGEIQTGPHLHFELWENETPVDPEDYILFN
jgi:murein DD-endopeptidase MepM/ murein hydrolase activator NlpD